MRKALRAAAMSVMSFYDIQFTYDQSYLIKALDRCRNSVHELIKPHLTDKSHERCDLVFDFLGHPDFLEAVFTNSELQPILGALVADIAKAIECGQL